MTKIEPVKAWAALNDDGEIEIAALHHEDPSPFFVMIDLDRHVIPVLITPLENEDE